MNDGVTTIMIQSLVNASDVVKVLEKPLPKYTKAIHYVIIASI